MQVTPRPKEAWKKRRISKVPDRARFQVVVLKLLQRPLGIGEGSISLVAADGVFIELRKCKTPISINKIKVHQNEFPNTLFQGLREGRPQTQDGAALTLGWIKVALSGRGEAGLALVGKDELKGVGAQLFTKTTRRFTFLPTLSHHYSGFFTFFHLLSDKKK
jgi:hypothetical protein